MSNEMLAWLPYSTFNILLKTLDEFEIGGQDFLHGKVERRHGNSLKTLRPKQERKIKDSCCNEMTLDMEMIIARLLQTCVRSIDVSYYLLQTPID